MLLWGQVMGILDKLGKLFLSQLNLFITIVFFLGFLILLHLLLWVEIVLFIEVLLALSLFLFRWDLINGFLIKLHVVLVVDVLIGELWILLILRQSFF